MASASKYHPGGAIHSRPPKGGVDIGTAIAINRQGPVKPGTNIPLRPRKPKMK